METKINIAEILRNKPRGIKLYSPIFGDCTYCYIQGETSDICVKRQYNVMSYFNFEGLYNTAGECLLFPSKLMRDWEKLSWKKGDVLKNTAYEERVIFDGFLNDDYTYFKGKHPLDCSYKFKITYHEECNCFTGNYRLESTDAAQTYINTIEERLGGKLNRETLEIEKIQPEFKDGDIIKMTWDKYLAIAIFWKYSNFGKGFDSHVFFNIKTKIIEYNIHGHTLQDMILRLATEEEKQQLFSALEKKGKRWDSEKKAIVDFKQKVELKPFDKVIVRCGKSDKWSIDFFSHKVSDGYICAGDTWFEYCLPYNDETVKLIGTTNDLEGGEQ